MQLLEDLQQHYQIRRGRSLPVDRLIYSSSLILQAEVYGRLAIPGAPEPRDSVRSHRPGCRVKKFVFPAGH
jgi:hypothetical protein